MGSAILAVLQIMKHLVWNFIYLLRIVNYHQIVMILAFVIREKQGSTYGFSELLVPLQQLLWAQL